MSVAISTRKPATMTDWHNRAAILASKGIVSKLEVKDFADKWPVVPVLDQSRAHRVFANITPFFAI